MSGVSRDPIIVVGAGIGGLTCALALLRRGIDVEVYEQAPQLAEIGELLKTQRIQPVIDKVFPFEQANDALAYLDQGRAKGKVVIKMR